MALSPDEEKFVRDLKRGIEETGSNGYGFAKYGVLNIRHHRESPHGGGADVDTVVAKVLDRLKKALS